MPGPKPKLAVTTPLTATFPPEVTGGGQKSARSPLSSVSYPGLPRSAGVFESDPNKTPISPPTAYGDFLRFMSLNSPLVTGKSTTSFTFSPTSAPSSATSSGATTPSSAVSAPSTAASEACACKQVDICSHSVKQKKRDDPASDENSKGDGKEKTKEDGVKVKEETETEKEKEMPNPKKRRHPDPLPPPAPISTTRSAPLIPPSPFDRPLLSAPATGLIPDFPSLHIPPSPALCLDSPISGITALSAATRSPFSARGVRSSFDWEAALKARRMEGGTKPPQSAPVASTPTNAVAKGPSKTSVRHIREVVTRTVTYMPTPKMDPAPKGKRRKVE